MSNPATIDQLTAHLFRENSGKMTAVLSRIFGLDQIDTVLDVVQDTFEAALSKWRFSGIPDNPAGWLMQVAKNKACNTFKRAGKTQTFSASAYLHQSDGSFEQQLDLLLVPDEIKDSQLRLLFACCHPGFSVKNQIMITLNILCGFGVREIAGALLMKEEAVKKALTRSKATLRGMDNILQTSITRTDEQIRTVQTILYLMFNEGYKTTGSKEAINNDLCYEAIRLAGIIEKDNSAVNSETNALLALMFFNISRFPARLGASDEWLTLAEQDRSLWNGIFIEEGYRYLDKATRSRMLSRFHIEAIIASLHCSASSFEATDWIKIGWLYRQLEHIDPSPLVKLNRIIAESYLPGTDSLQELDRLIIHMDTKGNFLVVVAKGDICKRRGMLSRAFEHYMHALSLAVSPADRKFLEKKIQECGG